MHSSLANATLLAVRRLVACTVGTSMLAGSLTSLAGGVPAEDFVKQLRNAGYFDTAITYLDRADQLPGVTADFLAAVPLEKAQTFIDAAVAARSGQQRDGFFLSAENELKAFLENADHPRFSEARLQLGNLRLVRADQLMSAADPSDEARKAARESCVAAAATFDAIIADLRGRLESMQGQRIDAAKQPEQAALRDRYRGEFLQALVRSGEARQMAARTFRDPATEGESLLEEALVTFTDLSEKYDNYLQGALAVLSRGQVEQALGRDAEAIDSFQRVLEQTDADDLRSAKLQAMAALVGLRIAGESPNFETIIGPAKRLLDGARPNERRSPEYGELQVALAKAYFAQSESLTAAGKQSEARRLLSANARPLLNSAVKIAGGHESTARELLATLGVESETGKTTETLPEPKSLDEALVTARELMQVNDELSKTRKSLTERGDDEQAAGEIESIDDQLATGRAQLVSLLRSGLALGGSDVDQRNQAREFLVYTLYQSGDHWDSAVVGQFLSRSAANKPEGLRGGLLALSSLQTLLRDLSDESKSGIVRQIEMVGEHLTRTWPDEPRAAAAKGVMIKLALDDDRWDDARELLEKLPAGGERASYQRLMGQLLWNQSLILKQEDRGDEAVALLPEAATELRSGLDGIPGELAGPEALQAALVLAKIELRRGDPVAALSVLDHAKYGPAVLIKKLDEPNPGFKADLFSTELQALVGVMTTDEGDTESLLERADEVMTRLQATADGDAEAGERLVRTYVSMARDIQDQLDDADPARRKKLISAFQVFLNSIAGSADNPATLQWVGQTQMQLGESSMEKGQIRAQGDAAKLISSAIKTFESLTQRLDDEAPATLRFQLGRGYRLAGEYKQAIDLFEKILTDSPMMLDAQIEAARTYEQWAGRIDPRYATKAYESALVGARPGEDRKNRIWGWGRISKLVSSRPEFRDTFFQARYHVAFCRFMMGKSSDNKRLIEQAANDINQVASLYPDLGGNQRRQEFDLLMKEIQKALGKNPDGLPAQPANPG